MAHGAETLSRFYACIRARARYNGVSGSAMWGVTAGRMWLARKTVSLRRKSRPRAEFVNPSTVVSIERPTPGLPGFFAFRGSVV